MRSEPLVSAIMPTRARQVFAVAALECWLAQTYPHRELVIVDDADAPSFPTAPNELGVSYHRLPARLTIGAKRNIACSRAAGEIVCHWDDDDWSAPERIADQVARLVESAKQMTGYHSMVFRSEQGSRWQYRSPNADYAIGTSLMYWRSFWLQHVFPALESGEDTSLWMAALRQKQVVACDAAGMMIATIHGGNTSPRQLGSRNYQEIPACA